MEDPPLKGGEVKMEDSPVKGGEQKMGDPSLTRAGKYYTLLPWSVHLGTHLTQGMGNWSLRCFATLS